jgi:hypothetical protein
MLGSSSFLMLRGAKLVKVAKNDSTYSRTTFTPDEIVTVHVMNRAVRRCFLMGFDQCTGKNYDYRKQWIEQCIEHLAQNFRASSTVPDSATVIEPQSNIWRRGKRKVVKKEMDSSGDSLSRLHPTKLFFYLLPL